MRNVGKTVYWAPRIFAILLLVFLSLFSLDVIEPGKSAGYIALGLFMHNIPVLILLALLVVSWRKEIVGGYTFLVAGIFYLVFNLLRVPDHRLIAFAYTLPLLVPLLLTSFLFFYNWYKRKKTT